MFFISFSRSSFEFAEGSHGAADSECCDTWTVKDFSGFALLPNGVSVEG